MIWLSCEGRWDTTDDEADDLTARGVGLMFGHSLQFQYLHGKSVYFAWPLCQVTSLECPLWTYTWRKSLLRFYCIAAAVLSSTNKLTTQIIVLTVYKIQIGRKQKWNMFCLVYWQYTDIFCIVTSVSNVFFQYHPD